MSTIDDLILCEVCMTCKPINKFRGRSGVVSRCSDCRVAEYNRAYYQKNKERLDQKTAQNRAINGDRYRETQRRHYVANREYYRERSRAWQAANPERRREQMRAWQAANPERHRANVRASKRRNPDSIRAAKQRRRARLLGNGGSYSAAEWLKMCDHFGNVCLCCGGPGPLTVDHVIPIVAGGRNSIDNLQPLCKPCNLLKKARTIDYRDSALLAALLAVLDKGGN